MKRLLPIQRLSDNLDTMIFALLLLVPAFVSAALPPGFQCSSNGMQVHIYLEKAANRLDIISSANKRSIPLSSPNATFSKNLPGEWLVYNGLNGGNLDLGQEVAILYKVEESGTQAVLLVTIDHRLLQPMTCTSTKSLVKISSTPTKIEQQKTISERMAAFASLRKKSGALENNAEAMVAEMIQRIFLISPNGFPKEWLHELRPHILKIPKSSMSAIALDLKGESKRAWQSVLKEINYDYFPESERFIYWIKEGVRPGPLRDLDSVTAAFNGFARLPAFRSPDLRKHFISETIPFVKEIAESETQNLRTGMSETAKALFSEIWIAATGKKTIANYPLLEEILKNLSAALKKKPEEFDPQTVEKRAMAFFKSSLAQDADAKRIFLENARPLFQSLSARQIEDLNSWVEDDDRPLFELLLK